MYIAALFALLVAIPLTMTDCRADSTPQSVVSSSLVAYWPGTSKINDVVGGNNGTPCGGVRLDTHEGAIGFDFDGKTGRIAVPDAPALAITKSLAISAWIKLRANPTSLSFILFRGDDRPGLDPYKLFVNPDGTLGLSISDADGNEVQAISPAPLPTGIWVFVAGSLDDSTGTLSVYVNGTAVATRTTTIRPFGPLDPSKSPGLGIGNAQSGNYAACFNGLISDLKLYNSVHPISTPN